MTRSPVLIAVTIAAIALAGCTSTTPGAATTPTTPAATSASPTTGGGSAADPMANVDPCTLLSPAIVSQNGLAPGQNRPEPGARTCFWDKSADTSGSGYSVGVGIYDHAGLDQLNTTDFTVTDYQVGRHQGKLSKSLSGGTCDVSIAINGSSRVDVVGVDGGGRVEQACTVATLVAPSVEQKLPVGGN